jgi:hypothetical protein
MVLFIFPMLSGPLALYEYHFPYWEASYDFDLEVDSLDSRFHLGVYANSIRGHVVASRYCVQLVSTASLP